VTKSNNQEATKDLSINELSQRVNKFMIKNKNEHQGTQLSNVKLSFCLLYVLEDVQFSLFCHAASLKYIKHNKNIKEQNH